MILGVDSECNHPPSLRNFGIEEIELSPLHLNWLTSLRLRRKLVRVRKQVTILGVIHRAPASCTCPRNYQRQRSCTLVEAHLAKIDAFPHNRAERRYVHTDFFTDPASRAMKIVERESS
jgi:hypothetical protein